MRATCTLSTLLLGVALASCGSKSASFASCEPPTGCVRSSLVAGSCQCLEWQLVSIEPAPVRFMVVGIIYSPLGNQSTVSYGPFRPTLSVPAISSDLGTRWRSVIQAADGTERVATLGPSDFAMVGSFGPYAAVTATTAALTSVWGITSYTAFDVTSHENDQIFVWINPAAAVTTDYAGEKAVSWSWTADCILPGGCPSGADAWIFKAGELDGTYPPPTNPFLLAMYNGLDAADRAAILKYDPFFDPPGRDPATIASDPRFAQLTTVDIEPGSSSTPINLSWAPCTGTLTDDGFQALAQAATPFGARETLVVQNSVLSTTAACMPQTPSLEIGTTTTGCSIAADVLIDKVFGTLIMVPTSIGPSCTVSP